MQHWKEISAVTEGALTAIASEQQSNEISGDVPADAIHISELLSRDLLPLLTRLHAEAQALVVSSKRGEVAEHAARIHDLAEEAEAEAAELAQLIALFEGKRPLDLAMVDLSDVLMSLLARWKTKAPSHAFELALPGEIPLISADAAQAEAALHALIEDAVVLTAPGGTIRVSIRPEHETVLVSLHPGATLPQRAVGAYEDVIKYDDESQGAEPGQVRGAIHFALARVILARHGGRVWREGGAAGAAVTLRASWRLVAQVAAADTPLAVVPSNQQVSFGEMPRAAAVQGVRSKTLIWEPDARMARYLRSNLEARQMRPIVASSLEEVPRLIALEEPDVLVLEVMSEERIATLIAGVAHLTQAPVILLAAEYDAEVCARLLDAGAADYIAKPLHIDELLARLRVAMRAHRVTDVSPRGESHFRAGELLINFAERRVTVGEREVSLSKTEFKLLRTLAQNAGKVLSHDWLLERVWGAGYRQETEFIWVYVRRLRRKIEPDPKHPRYVITVPGVGYRLAKT